MMKSLDKLFNAWSDAVNKQPKDKQDALVAELKKNSWRGDVPRSEKPPPKPLYNPHK